MKIKIILSSILIFYFNLKVDAQIFLKIANTNNIFRYYSSAPKNVEEINDSVKVSIIKKKNYYIFRIYQEGKAVNACCYIFTNEVSKEIITRRIFDRDGERFEKVERKIYILHPMKDDCLRRYLSN